MVTVVTASDLVNVNQLNFIASQEDEAKVVMAVRWQWWQREIWWWWPRFWCRQAWCEELFCLSSNLLSNNLNRDHGLLKAWVHEQTHQWASPLTLGDTTSGALYFESFCPITEGNLCWLSFQSASLVAVDAGNPTFRHSLKNPIIQRFILTIFLVNKYLNSRITWSLMQLLLLFAHFIAGTSG